MNLSNFIEFFTYYFLHYSVFPTAPERPSGSFDPRRLRRLKNRRPSGGLPGIPRRPLRSAWRWILWAARHDAQENRQNETRPSPAERLESPCFAQLHRRGFIGHDMGQVHFAFQNMSSKRKRIRYNSRVSRRPRVGFSSTAPSASACLRSCSAVLCPAAGIRLWRFHADGHDVHPVVLLVANRSREMAQEP